MIEIEKPQIECTETPGDATYGKYVVEPLERGYGTTLGNALRRIMLSSLPGTAPTTIKIAGVQHEFSTVPGVKEDVTEIVLNVKGLLTKLHCETVKTVYIEAVGPCEVTAGDIKADGEVEVLNPDLHIATLDNGATLNMEITLSLSLIHISSTVFRPCSIAARAAVSAAVWAAKGVDFLLPRKPRPPEEAQDRALPCVSVTVTIVLLKEERIWTWPRSMFFFSRRRRMTFLPPVAFAVAIFVLPPYFFLLAMVFLGPLRVLALVLLRWPRTGRCV